MKGVHFDNIMDGNEYGVSRTSRRHWLAKAGMVGAVALVSPRTGSGSGEEARGWRRFAQPQDDEGRSLTVQHVGREGDQALTT